MMLAELFSVTALALSFTVIAIPFTVIASVAKQSISDNALIEDALSVRDCFVATLLEMTARGDAMTALLLVTLAL
jgi:hypothetical protein